MSEDFELRYTTGEVSVEWNIKEFMSLPSEVGYCIDSPTFSLSDAKWCIQLYPNGIIDRDDCASLFLCRKSSLSEKHQVDYTLGIRRSDSNQSSGSHKFEFVKTNTRHGFDRFIYKSSLKDPNNVLVQNGSVTVTCTARVSTGWVEGDSALEIACQASLTKSSEILQQNLKDLFQSGRHCDVTIKVKGQEFQAHRTILVARSSVFSAMFDHDTEEKKTGIVNIADCDPESFKDFMSFLYTGEVDMVCSNNSVSLFRIADKYDLKDLKAECVRCMSEHMSVETFCDVILLATMHNESELLESANNFFVENVKTILQSFMWQSFISENITLANELFIQLVNKKL